MRSGDRGPIDWQHLAPSRLSEFILSLVGPGINVPVQLETVCEVARGLLRNEFFATPRAKCRSFFLENDSVPAIVKNGCQFCGREIGGGMV